MRLAILMSLKSPWSREAAVQLSKTAGAVHVIGVRSPQEDPNESYLKLDTSDFKLLQNCVTGVHFLDSRFRSELRYLLLAPALAKTLRRINADILLTLYGGGFSGMAFASRFRPYAVFVVGSDVLMSRGLRREMTRIFLNAAKCVFVNGNHLAERTRELAPAARLVPLHLGVDTGRFIPRRRPQAPIRIVCTRGFMPVYNNDFLIQALARMPATKQDFSLTFVSGGPLLEQSRRLADQLLPPEIRQRVEFLGGVSDDRLVEIVSSSHIYVSTSRSDGTSSSLLEALSSGLFPILSDIPQNREWVDLSSSVSNGILVPLDQPTALAEALHTAIVHERLRNSVAEYNRNLVVARADSSRNMATLADMLESIVQDKGRSA